MIRFSISYWKSAGAIIMADLILYGGDIITMREESPGNSKVEAVAISGGKILDVGSIDSVFSHKNENTRVIFLDQQTLMPGFIEPHHHAIYCVEERSMFTTINGVICRTYSDVRAKINKKLDELKESSVDPANGKWGIFFGWDPELIADLPILSASYLDKNYSDVIPVVVVAQNLHIGWANTAALKRASIRDDIQNPTGGTYVKDQDGHLTGQLLTASIYEVIGHAPKPTKQQMIRIIQDQWRYYASAGFTTVTELCYKPIQGLLEEVKIVADSCECPIRLGLYNYTVAEKKGGAVDAHPSGHGICNYSSKLWEAGVKLISDGSPHCGTAAVREPYLDTPITQRLCFPPAPGYGKLLNSNEALLDTISKFHVQGKQVAVHCHGERAVEQILKIYERILVEDPSNTRRHRMEHLGLITAEQIARAGKINVALSFFVDHLHFYAPIYKTGIFGDRVNRWTPLSEATRNGITWTIHQDHPAFPGEINPFGNMKTAVTRCSRDDPDHPYGPEYRVSIHEALKAYTVNAAWQLHIDKDVGSIEVGKKADLVVLSENPYRVDPFDLERIRIIETFLEGRRNNIAILKSQNTGSNNVYVLNRP